METRRLTMAQAIVQYLKVQYVSRDGVEQPFFGGMFGIFGHGNVAGIGQALHQYADEFRFYQTRNGELCKLGFWRFGDEYFFNLSSQDFGGGSSTGGNNFSGALLKPSSTVGVAPEW